MGIKTLARCPPRAFLLSARFHKYPYPPVSLVFFSFVPLALLPPSPSVLSQHHQAPADQQQAIALPLRLRLHLGFHRRPFPSFFSCPPARPSRTVLGVS